jgi:hypothetical protein
MPTKEQIEECKKFSDITVSEKTLKEWYCLLRKAQGTLKPYFEGKLKYMIDSLCFIQDSLFCEWVYIINLDSEVLEIYSGYQKNKQFDEKNRYSEEYLTCKLIHVYPLNNLPTAKAFVNDLKGDDE